MVGTKHCCWGQCRSDSRYPQKLPNSLKEMLNSGQKAFIPFPKPSKGIEKCKRWIHACSRENFSLKNINKHTYICAFHWPGQKGPTKEHPDPLKANLSEREVAKAKRLKRKAPLPRSGGENSSVKRLKAENDHSMDLCDLNLNPTDVDVESVADTDLQRTDKGTQTNFTKYELSAKIENIILKNEVKAKTFSEDCLKVVSNLSFEIICKDSAKMEHFTGLSSANFDILYDFVNGVCPLNTITYWGFKGKHKSHPVKADRKVLRRVSKWSFREQLYMCLLRLKTGFAFKTMSILLSTPENKISQWSLRNIFTTYIQLLYKIFRDMEYVMFPSKESMRRFLPKVFKTMPNVRCSADCTEFKVEMSSNFERQGNTYSSYKHSNTFKCLIAVTPNGGACFVSDLFEGDISDVEIFLESGILKHIKPYDIILADRGFTVQDLLNPLQAKVKIPAFLKGRSSLSVAEELSTRKIAKARIHVERYNQRLKEFKLVGRKIPLSIAPLATQMVVVACGLVNFQDVLCK